MRRLLVSLVLVVAMVSYVNARSGQSPSSGSLTGGAGGVDGACVGAKVNLRDDLGGSGMTFNAPTSVVIGATAGRYTCSTFRMPCTAAGYTKLSFSLSVGLASSVGEVGIFDITGATRITSTGSKTEAASGNVDTTGLAPFTLTGGTQYLACHASSAVATVSVLSMNAGSPFNNAVANSAWVSGAAATQVAPFNEACTAGSTPYTCCTGLGTGTCLGMVDRVGIVGIAASTTAGPIIVIGP